MASSWELLEKYARAKRADSLVTLAPAHPNDGLTVQIGEQPSWRLLSVCPNPTHSLSPEEIYVRDQDLISRFDQLDSDTFGFQLDWKLLEPEAPQIWAFELWASVQTDLLDSSPSLTVACRSPAQEPWRVLSASELLSQSTSGQSEDAQRSPAILVSTSHGMVGVWMIEPTDQRHTRLVENQGEECAVNLFEHFMEKGVIRRARMRFYLVGGDVSDDAIISLYRRFADSPLPLTA